MKKAGITILFLIIIAGIGFSVWYSPVVFKGYAPYKVSELVPIARNIYKTGVFSLENEQNVFLSSSVVKEKGEIAASGNKLTAYLYARVFKVTGILGPNDLVVASIIFNLLSLLVFSFIILRLFGLKIAGLFSLAYILMPFNWQQIYSLGSYEFGVLLLSLFFLFFILGRDKKNEAAFVLASGIFLALAALSREVFFLLIPILPVYFWFSQKRKLIIYFLIPIIIMLSVFYFPALFKGDGDNYIKHFFAGPDKKEEFVDFNFYAHLYPDPYVYHFERDEFLANYNEKIEKTGFLESLQMKKVLANLGERSIKLHERFLLGLVLLFSHISKFFSLELMGGPFVLFFSLVGLIYLKTRDKQLYKFSLYWVLGTIFLLSFVVMVSRSHLIDFNWLIPLLASLGVFYLLEIFLEKLVLSYKKSAALFLFLCLVVLYSLLTANHVVFGKLYDDPTQLKMETYAEKIKKSNVLDANVIALGLNSKEILTLNYLTDKSMVVFAPKTIEKLIEQNKLKKAFDDFGVRYILGYDDRVSLNILKHTEVYNIASSSISIDIKETSPLQSMFLGLVK